MAAAASAPAAVPNTGRSESSLTTVGAPQASAIGVQVAVTQQPSDRHAMDALTMAVLEPFAKIAGSYLAEKFKYGLTEDERENINSHTRAVQENGVSTKNISTSRKAEKTVEWAAEAANVNGENPELSAAWRATLESIMVENDYPMIDRVKQMNKADVSAILKILSGQDFHNPEIGEKLSRLEIARRRFTKGRAAKSYFYTILSLSICLLGAYLGIEQIAELRSMNGDNRSFYRALFPVMIGSSIIFLLLRLYLISEYFVIYTLTSYGEHFAQKVLKYMPAEHELKH